jgi:hypothetical protein
MYLSDELHSPAVVPAVWLNMIIDKEKGGYPPMLKLSGML